jgi:hypothetical protein
VVEKIIIGEKGWNKLRRRYLFQNITINKDVDVAMSIKSWS